MTRRNVEIDLPGRFAKHYAQPIETFLADAIPGMVLNLLVRPKNEPAALTSPFVSSSSIERNIITLRAVELLGASGPCLLLEPADAYSRRLVDLENDRLKPAESHLEHPHPLKSAFHAGGSRPLMTGYPVTGSFGAGW